MKIKPFVIPIRKVLLVHNPKFYQMHIGLIYDLRDDYLALGWNKEKAAEFDTAETINALEQTIQSLGYKVTRIGNIKQLVNRLSKNERWDLVFNIAEGAFGEARESQVPALLDAYQIPYCFSDPLVLAVTLDKSLAKMIVDKANIPTAPFFKINKIEELQKVDLEFPLFLKPIAEGTGKGVSSSSYVTNKKELEKTAKELLTQFSQAVLVERFLPGREFTVGILGNGKEAEVVGVMEIIMSSSAENWGYSYKNKANYQDLVEYKLVYDDAAKDAAEVAKNSWVALNCLDGGRVDIRLNHKGQANFIEVNPLAGLNPTDGDLIILAKKANMTYKQVIGKIIKSACKRHNLKQDETNINFA